MVTTYATEQDLANYLQEPVRTTQARLALRMATARITAATGVNFSYRANDVVRLRGGTPRLVLPGAPIHEVGSVRVPDEAWAWSTLDPLYYWLDGDELAWADDFSLWPDLAEITLTHGYDPIPYDVMGCCLALTSELLESPDGSTFERIDDYASRRPDHKDGLGASLLRELTARYGVTGGIYSVRACR